MVYFEGGDDLVNGGKESAEKAAKEMKSSILNKEEPKPEDSPEFTVTDFEEQEKAA